jgi:AraC-like DNA-binding protein
VASVREGDETDRASSGGGAPPVTTGDQTELAGEPDRADRALVAARDEADLAPRPLGRDGAERGPGGMYSGSVSSSSPCQLQAGQSTSPHNMLQHAVSQAAASTPGSDVIIAHLAEVLFTEVLRRYLSALPDGRTGWLAGAGDPAVGRALAALHKEPTFDWTLDSLAHETGISRSALTEKFTRFIGQAPMAYLTDWRLELGAEALRSTSRSVQRVALDSGYESEAAFNRAFKRRFSVPPARYRRVARAKVATKIPPAPERRMAVT